MVSMCSSELHLCHAKSELVLPDRIVEVVSFGESKAFQPGASASRNTLKYQARCAAAMRLKGVD